MTALSPLLLGKLWRHPLRSATSRLHSAPLTLTLMLYQYGAHISALRPGVPTVTPIAIPSHEWAGALSYSEN